LTWVAVGSLKLVNAKVWNKTNRKRLSRPKEESQKVTTDTRDLGGKTESKEGRGSQGVDAHAPKTYLTGKKKVARKNRKNRGKLIG